jgi:ribonuclease HI
LKKIEIYTDGACSGNPGPGGWAAILKFKDNIREISGHINNTTNNIMEMTAIIKALELLNDNCDIEVYTDSKYLKDGITSWIHNWKKNNWKNSAKQEVKNKELWIRLDQLCVEHKIQWHWVKAHNGHHYNERADALAVAARDIAKAQ